MYRKLIIVSLLQCTIYFMSTAQYGYFNEALLFSQTGFGSTSRIQSIGSSQIALGGDLSHANSNPAGLGFFNRNIFSFTPSLDNYVNQSNYFGNKLTEGKGNINIGQLGVLFNYGNGSLDIDEFRGGSLAISMNKVNDFHNKIVYTGHNNYNSIINSIIENPSSGIYDGAFDNFIINSHENNYIFDEINGEILGFDTIPNSNGLSSPFEASVPQQKEIIETFGGQYTFNIAYGGNLSDFFYFGGGIGVHSLDYKKKRTYTENDYFVVTERFSNGDVNGFNEDALNNLTVTDRLTITGAGVNVNFGIIVRPINFITIGFAYQSPTILGLEERGNYDFQTAYFDKYDYTIVTFNENAIASQPESKYLYTTYDLEELSYLSETKISNYTLKTPSKFNIGTAVFLGKLGFVSADVEMINYSNSRLRSHDVIMTDDNAVIDNIYKSTFNYRVGSEIRLKNLRFGAGYAYQADPYKNSGFNRNINQLSTGVGYRKKDYFVDFVAIYKWQNQFYSPYTISFNQPVADTKSAKITTAITVGIAF